VYILISKSTGVEAGTKPMTALKDAKDLEDRDGHNYLYQVLLPRPILTRSMRHGVWGGARTREPFGDRKEEAIGRGAINIHNHRFSFN